MTDFAALLKDKVPPAGTFPACFAFSIHKAGSSLMNGMLVDLCKALKIPAASIPDLLFNQGVQDADWNDSPALAELIGDGRVYCGFRYFPPFLAPHAEWLATRPTVLLVRDPRDALVSEYFSMGRAMFSHAVPKQNPEAFLAMLKERPELDIDDYVMRAAPVHLRKLEQYRQHLDLARISIFRYEVIFFDKPQFLRDVFSCFQLPVTEAAIASVAAKHDLRPTTEDPTKHVRVATPGDHALKLKPQTIADLTALFKGPCTAFGYDLA